MAGHWKKIDELRAGDRIARDLTDATGAVLMKEGVTLDETKIDRLKTRRVPGAFIEGAPGAGGEGEALDPEIAAAAADAVLDHMFSEVMDQPVMVQILDIAKQYSRTRAARGSAGPPPATGG